MNRDCEHFLILKNGFVRCELAYTLKDRCGNACSQYRPERGQATKGSVADNRLLGEGASKANKDTRFKWGETIGIGFLREDSEEEDFLLIPTIGIGFAKNDEFRAMGIGLKFGFWALALAIKLKRKPPAGSFA